VLSDSRRTYFFLKGVNGVWRGFELGFLVFMKVLRVINSLLIVSFLLSTPTLVCAATLAHRIQLVLESHPDVQTTRILRDATERDVASTRWQFYPTVVGSVTGVSTANNDRSFLGDDYVANAGIVQPLWTGGSLTGNLDVAKAGFKQSLTIHESLSGQVQRRALGGASSESDTALAKARVAMTEVDLADHYAQPVDLFGDFSNLNLLTQDKNPIGMVEIAEVAQARVGAVRAQSMPEVNLRLKRQNGNVGFADSSSSYRVCFEFTSLFGAGLSRHSDASAARLRRGISQCRKSEADIVLKPEMTANVSIRTGTRTVLRYLIKPIQRGFQGAFSEGRCT